MTEPTVELDIERLSLTGEGVGQHQNRAVFVPGALPKERVRIALKESGKVLTGTLLEVLKPHPGRRPPACPLSETCGGCDWLFADEAVQQAAKEEIVLSTLEHLGGIPRSSVKVLPFLASPVSMGYRRRAVFHLGGGRLGFFGRKSHQHVAVDHCPALTPGLAHLPQGLSDCLQDIARELVSVTVLEEGSQVSVGLELKGKMKPRVQEAVEKALRKLPLSGAVVVPKEGGVELFGKPVLEGLAPQVPGQPLLMRPDAFVQANPAGNALLVSSALALLEPQAQDRVLELYSGNGNFSFALGEKVLEVVSVESSLVSVELAQKAGKKGAVQTVRFIHGDVEKVCDGLMKEGREFTRLLLDPPRSGAPGVGKWALALEVGRVVYVACDAASLARDARELIYAGYRPLALQVIDMFPQTHHVEVVMSFERELTPRRP